VRTLNSVVSLLVFFLCVFSFADEIKYESLPPRSGYEIGNHSADTIQKKQTATQWKEQKEQLGNLKSKDRLTRQSAAVSFSQAHLVQHLFIHDLLILAAESRENEDSQYSTSRAASDALLYDAEPLGLVQTELDEIAVSSQYTAHQRGFAKKISTELTERWRKLLQDRMDEAVKAHRLKRLQP